MNLNKRLFDLLYQSRRTQKDLAEALGISERNVSSWKMRGSDPPANLIVGIAAFFGANVPAAILSIVILFAGVVLASLAIANVQKEFHGGF